MKTAQKKSTATASPKKQLAGFMAKFTPVMAKRIGECRAEIQKILPTANELVYDNYNFFVIGYSATERPSDSIVCLAANSKGVGLAFYYGSTLPDPQKLLLGNGHQNRFVRLPTVETLREPGVRALIDAAISQADPKAAGEGQGNIDHSVRRGQTAAKKVTELVA